MSLRRESLRVAGPKRLVLLSRAFDPNTPIFNGENLNASYLQWPAWIIKFQNPQILDFNFSLQKLSSHKKRLKGITIRTNHGLYSKNIILRYFLKRCSLLPFSSSIWEKPGCVTGWSPLEICKFQTRDFVNRVSVGYIAQ